MPYEYEKYVNKNNNFERLYSQKKFLEISSDNPINKQKKSALQTSALSIYTGHKMQCPPPLASVNYLQ